jgi:hypothetical protein
MPKVAALPVVALCAGGSRDRGGAAFSAHPDSLPSRQN